MTHDHPSRSESRLRRLGISVNSTLLAGSVLFLAVLLVALAAPWFFPGDPHDMVATPLLPPGSNWSYPLGTDALGCDVAAGIAYGARASLLVGLLAAGLAVAVGTTVGLVAGYLRGATDSILMRICELFQTIPPFLLAIFAVAIFGASLRNIIIAMGLTSWPAIARVVRAQTLALRELDFVRAASAMGVSESRIVLVHLLPNVLPSVVNSASILASIAILGESGLAFLGLGDPDLVTWGSMIGAGREMIRTAPYLSFLPGVAIVLTILSLNLLGDGLTFVLNPRENT
jgi:peptide/nickel transport system permease protein